MSTMLQYLFKHIEEVYYNMLNFFKHNICSEASRSNARQLIQLSGWNACNNIVYQSTLIHTYNSIDQFRFTKNIPSKCVILKRTSIIDNIINDMSCYGGGYDSLSLIQKIDIYLEEKRILKWYLDNTRWKVCKNPQTCYNKLWWS